MSFSIYTIILYLYSIYRHTHTHMIQFLLYYISTLHQQWRNARGKHVYVGIVQNVVVFVFVFFFHVGKLSRVFLFLSLTPFESLSFFYSSSPPPPLLWFLYRSHTFLIHCMCRVLCSVCMFKHFFPFLLYVFYTCMFYLYKSKTLFFQPKLFEFV